MFLFFTLDAETMQTNSIKSEFVTFSACDSSLKHCAYNFVVDFILSYFSNHIRKVFLMAVRSSELSNRDRDVRLCLVFHLYAFTHFFSSRFSFRFGFKSFSQMLMMCVYAICFVHWLAFQILN